MTHGRVTVMLLVFGLVAVSAPTMAQEVPETAWGAPDLQGVWDFRTITPLERPEDLSDQELAGHANLGTTQRYMHLSPAAIESAIKLLDQPVSDLVRGDIGETGQVTW